MNLHSVNPHFARLLAGLDRAASPRPEDLEAALAALPPAADLPSPWVAWTLICLIRYRLRKIWAMETLRSRVAPRLARREGGPDCLDGPRGRCIVPGMPDWEFLRDGNDSRLTNRVTGERIHVDVLNGPEVINRWRFGDDLLALRQPEPAEQRLLELHPGCKTLTLAVDELLRAFPHHEIDETDFALCGSVLGHERAIASHCARWPDPDQRVWLGALINDWPAAHEAALRLGDPALIELSGRRSEECRRLHLDRLRAEVEESGLDELTLRALADAGAPEVPQLLEAALATPGDATAAALDLVAEDPRHLGQVIRLARRLGADMRGNYQYLATPCAEYLVKHSRTPEVIATLASPGFRKPGEAAILALELADASAMPLLRRALREDHHADRLAAAAALALVDRPWSRGELRAVLYESADPDRTIEARAALRESRDPQARHAADEWEARHPGHDDIPAPSDRFTYRILYGDCEHALREEMDRLRDHVAAIRDRPFEPSASGA